MSRLNDDRLNAPVSLKQIYVEIGAHQQCKLISVNENEIIYWHSKVGEMKFDYNSFTPNLLRHKIDDLLYD